MNPGASRSTHPGAAELSVIVPARNAGQTIVDQLAALGSQVWDGSWEVIVVDNGSTDDTASLVARFASEDDRIRLIVDSTDVGAAHARNVGMDRAVGRGFAFCDADDVVRPGWIAAIGEALRQHDFVAGRNDVENLNEPWLRTAFYQRPQERLDSFAGIFPIAATCNMGVRKDAIDAVGRFDTELLIGEDLHLCLRMWAHGFTLTYVPDAVVDYRYRPTYSALWKRSRQYGAAGPALARRVDALGTVRLGRTLGARNWLWLIRNLPTLRTKAGRARWVVVAGTRIGRITGSIRHRRLLL